MKLEMNTVDKQLIEHWNKLRKKPKLIVCEYICLEIIDIYLNKDNLLILIKYKLLRFFF